MSLSADLIPAEESGFVALHPETDTASQDESVPEALSNLREAAELYLEEFPLSSSGQPLLTTCEVAAPVHAWPVAHLRAGSIGALQPHMKALSIFAAVLSLTCSCVHAVPTFNPKAALEWCIDTVVSPVPVAKRIYVLGPDKTKEAYGLNGGIAHHELETRIAVECADGLTLAGVFQLLPQYKGEFYVSVWRASAEPPSKGGDKPLFTASLHEASLSNLVLRPDDLVEIMRPSSGFQP